MLPTRGSKPRRKGPLRFIEIFTWSCVMTMTAYDRGWETFQPVTLPHWDMRQRAHREDARKYLQDVDPDMVMISPECTPWCILQNWNQRTPLQCRELQRKKEDGRESLKFAEEVVQWQFARQRRVLVENPLGSMAWQEAPMIAAFSGPEAGSVAVDMCAYNLRRPGTGQLVRKSTMLKGSQSICQKLAKGRCNRKHQHSHITGTLAPNAAKIK